MSISTINRISCVIDELIGIDESLKASHGLRAYAFFKDFEGDVSMLSEEEKNVAMSLYDEVRGVMVPYPKYHTFTVEGLDL